MNLFQWSFLFLSISACANVCMAAPQGHEDENFRKCVMNCVSSPCEIVSPVLRLLQWNCRDECRYTCMWEDVALRQRTSLPIVQYYGKWPFIRIFGMQEFSSALFSLLNLLMHVIELRKYDKNVHKSYRLKKWILIYGLVSINVWICSTMFHMRDIPVTEKLDYFSAFATTVYGCFLATVRLASTKSFPHQSMILTLFMIPVCAYVNYYGRRRMNYELNMQLHIIVTLITILLWSYSAYLHRQSHAKIMFLCFILLGLFMSFELGDFSPFFFLVDAHAMWHLGTVFVIPIWYKFLTKDSLYDWKQQTLK